MRLIPYDASRHALFHPGSANDFFQLGPLETDAALCAEMSRLAYVKEESRLAQYLHRAQFQKQQSIGYGSIGTQVFIAGQVDGPVTVVAFRGSEPEDPSDLFADAEFAQQDWCDESGRRIGRVHAGFAAASQQNRSFETVRSEIGKLPQGRRVLITGHSLGAALATLMASWLPSAHLYTFGSPRVGDSAFVRALQNPVMVRHVNGCDIVTRIPPDTLFDYRHAGTLAYIDRHGKRVGLPTENAIEHDRAMATVEYLPHALTFGTVASRDLADHAPINYLSGVMGIRA